MDKLEYIPGDLVITNGVPYCYANEALVTNHPAKDINR